MKKFIVGLLSFCWLAAPALAAPTAIEKAPAFMQKMRPPQARTRFFSEVKFPTPVHNVYFLHFYEFPQTPPIMSGRDGVDKDYAADLFTRRIRGRKVSYRLVNRLRLNRAYFNSDVAAFDKVQAQFMWLVPAKRQIPILRMNFMVTDGFYGPFSEDVLFVFNEGLGAKYVMQGFYNYGSHIDSNSYSFDNIDERGFCVVTHRYQALGADRARYSDIAWNGSGFYTVILPTPTPAPLQ